MGGVLLHCVLREPGSCLSSQRVVAEEEGGEVPLVVVHIGGPAKVAVWREAGTSCNGCHTEWF